MKKFKFKKVFIIALIISFLLSAAIALMFIEDSFNVLADENSRTDNFSVSLDEKFANDSVIAELKAEYSSFNGISESLREKLFNLGVKSIKDLTAISENLLDKNGEIDKNKAPTLYEQFKDGSFSQLVKLELSQPSEQNVIKMVYALSEIDEIFSASPNYIYSTSSISNDTFIDNQWGLSGTHGINVERAWDVSTGSHNVRVGVIDSGISNHVDLNANVGVGYDFYNENTVTTDDLGGHGTHVAGIIGAVGNNGMGISGVAPDITLIPLQTAYDTTGYGWSKSEDIIEAITYATNLWDTDKRISILNYSILGYGDRPNILTVIKNYPGLFVWCAGNSNENLDVRYPDIAQYNISNLISVGSIDRDGSRSYFSNHGKNSVHIYAPGGSIYSTIPNNSYGYKSGTSMAAPHVTGAAALLLSYSPNLTAEQIKYLILNSANNIIIENENANLLNIGNLMTY